MLRDKSVMQLLPRLNEGGVERGTIEMNREFSKIGIRSLVVSAGGEMIPRISSDGGKHISFDIASKNLLTVPFRVLGLRRILNYYKPDLVHARSRVPAWLTYLANRKCRIPFVTTVHGINSVNQFSKIMTAGDQIICVGDPVMSHICKNYKTDKSKITVIPRGVDMNYFDPRKADSKIIKSLKKDWSIENKIVIGSIGRISRVKNFEVIIDAVAKLASTFPNITTLIIGGQKNLEDTYAESLRRHAEVKCPGRIQFAGSISNMREAYDCCNIIVNASPLMGNVARTLLESLAMDKPIVSTAMDGLEHVIKEGVNGYTFMSGDSDDLVRKLILLMGSRVVNARSTIPEKFKLDNMVSSTIEVYKKALL